MNARFFLAAALLASLVTFWRLRASANDVYYIDPVVEKNMRTITAPLSPQGGRIDLQVSDGVAAELSYPSNDACAGSTIFLGGLGPAGVDHFDMLDNISIYHKGQPGWQPFYMLTILVHERCSAQWLTLAGFPHLVLRIPNARAGTEYYADLVVESGNSTHIPLGPPDEGNSKNVDFDFGMLPMWARQAQYLRVPLGPTIRVIVARQ